MLKANAVTTDSLIIKDYKRGYEIVHEIIENNCLKDSLVNKPFCSLLFENLWTITVKKENSFVLYYGYRIGKEEVIRKEISNKETILNRLFSLEQTKIEQPIFKPKDFYTPVYWYFVLSDTLHNKRFEWNAYSQSEDKYAKTSLDTITNYYAYLSNITSNKNEK